MEINWIDNIVEKTYEHYKQRKIILWGKYPVSDSIREMLIKKYGITIAFYVDNNTEKIDNCQVFPTNCLAGKSKDYYIIIPLAFYQSLKNELTIWGYKKDIDYYYFADCIIQQTLDYYEDSHGNRIIGKYSGIKFAFSGFNSTIVIGNRVHFYESTIYVHNNVEIRLGNCVDLAKSDIFACDNAHIIIGSRTKVEKSTVRAGYDSDIIIEDDCIIYELVVSASKKANVSLRQGIKMLCGKNNWTISDGANVEIGSRGKFGEGTLAAYRNARIKIGNGFSINSTYLITADANTNIIIGDDCMISYDVIFRSNDGNHSIFDLDTGKNVNSTREISESRKIIIGDHVWIGMRSIILYNSEVKSGSIIGAASLVKSKIPNNCIAVGIPAKVIKENIAWDREPDAEFFQEKWDYRNEIEK